MGRRPVMEGYIKRGWLTARWRAMARISSRRRPTSWTASGRDRVLEHLVLLATLASPKSAGFPPYSAQVEELNWYRP